MVKLNQKKIDWIIKQKAQRVSSSEIARIQKITTRYVNMIYEKYKKDGEIIVNDPERKIKYQKIKKNWCLIAVLNKFDQCPIFVICFLYFLLFSFFMSSSNNKRWGKYHKDQRDWSKYNDELVVRSEFYLDLGFSEHWE